MERIKGIEKHLPEGWKEAAREKKALVRGRTIKTAEQLLELNLLHLTEGGSFGITAAYLNFATKTSISKQSVYERIQNSWQWLKWMTEEMCRENQFTIEKPDWLDRELVTIDGSEMSVKGSKQGDYRLHCAFEIFNFTYRSIEITDVKEGEKLSRHMIKPGDIALGDRMYGNIQGMEHVLSRGGDFILRYRTKGFNVYDENGEKIDLPEQFKDLAPMESLSLECVYYSEGKKRPVRLVAMRKDDEAIKTAHRKMTRKMNRQRGKAPSKEALELNQYIVLATSLDYSNERILELYRARWQIEQVFLRLKGLYSFGDVPSKNPDSVKAWFYGKLFLAVLGETILKRECFSPEDQNLMHSLGLIKLVESS
jgi:hypothetical protein